MEAPIIINSLGRAGFAVGALYSVLGFKYQGQSSYFLFLVASQSPVYVVLAPLQAQSGLLGASVVP